MAAYFLSEVEIMQLSIPVLFSLVLGHLMAYLYQKEPLNTCTWPQSLGVENKKAIDDAICEYNNYTTPRKIFTPCYLRR